MAKVSVKAAMRDARATERKEVTKDSFQNFALALGIGTQNTSTGNTYGFNPKTRVRTELEWMYRGAWLCGTAIDAIAQDMTREGVEILGELEPDEIAEINKEATRLKIWDRVGQTLKWSRLYGGCIAVLLIKGQDFSTPLRVDTVGTDQFGGLLVLDRWMVDPSLSDLVTEIGPDLGNPKYYTVLSNAPALRGAKIHHTRILRLIGDDLPYQQALMENLWGMSVLERPFPLISQYDAATAGASQLVHKAYLRYFKVKDYRKVMGGMGGAQAMRGLQEQVAAMRLFASNEGISMIDAEDDMVTQQGSAFNGIAEVLLQIAQQISGSFQIPLVRLLGQSPGGLNSTGDADFKNYDDGIKQRQQNIIGIITLIYRCIAQSLGIKIGDGFGVAFRPLRQMDEVAKADVALKDTQRVLSAHEAGIISDQTALEELQHISESTGRWKSIKREDIAAADDEILPTSEQIEAPPAPAMAGSGEEDKDEEGQGEEGRALAA